MCKNFKIGLVGLGSIGKRHLLNIVSVMEDRHYSYSIDLIRSGKGEAIKDDTAGIISNIYYSVDSAPNDYDIIFITNPTSMHYDTVKSFVPKTEHIFIEKPVFDRCDISLDFLHLKDKSIYYVACPLRYTKVIEYLKNNLDFKRVYSVRVICSSYLPDWRPNQDYRNTYSARKSQGGGVGIDLIHEWDYIHYLFGQPKQVFNIRGKFSQLEIDSDDLSIYIAEYADKAVELHLDYFGHKTIREIELFTDQDTIIGDMINSEIRYLKSGDKISFREQRDDFQRKEIEHFFDILEGKVENDNNILTALNTLKLAMGVYGT